MPDHADTEPAARERDAGRSRRLGEAVTCEVQSVTIVVIVPVHVFSNVAWACQLHIIFPCMTFLWWLQAGCLHLRTRGVPDLGVINLWAG